MWSASGVLLQYLRKWAGLNQQQLGDAIGYSLEQMASRPQRMRGLPSRHAGRGVGRVCRTVRG
jgi:hypothetical protein